MSADATNTNADQFGAAILRGGSFVAGIQVRVLKRETHNISATATQWALENGGSLSDHVLRTPNFVDVVFEMTNTTDNGEDGPSRAITVAAQFNKMIDNRTPVTLATEHFVYKNMVVVSFTPDHQAPNKGAYSATIRLQQVGVVGDAESVSAQGGRPASILAKDGTHLTAVGLTNDGYVEMITEGPGLERILAIAASKSLV